MSTGYSDDEILDGLGDASPPGPVAPPPAMAALKWPGFDPNTPAPAAPHSDHWFVLHVPRPRMPGRRTVFEAALVLLCLFLLIRPYVNLDGYRPPVPGPKVITGPLEARLIHDVEKDGFATAELKADATLAPRLKALDCGWGWMETSDPNVATLLGEHQPPAVAVFRRGTVQTVKVIDRPKTGDEVFAAVKAMRGKKD